MEKQRDREGTNKRNTDLVTINPRRSVLQLDSDFINDYWKHVRAGEHFADQYDALDDFIRYLRRRFSMPAYFHD